MKHLKAPHQKVIAAFLAMLTALFFLLAIWSYIPGEQIYQRTFSRPGQQLTVEQPKEPHGTFELDQQQVVQLNVSAAGLDNSWIWIKAVILDEKDRPVGDYAFNLEYYTGRDWSEGDRDTYQVFTLPKGKYKLLLFAQDADRNTYWTRPNPFDTQRIRIDVSIDKGVVLTRYFLMGGIFFIFLTFGYTRYARWSTKRYVRNELLELQPSDSVLWEGEEYDVDGKLTYWEASWFWTEFALLGDTKVLWLSIDGSTYDVTVWREVRDLEVDGHNPSFTLHYEGTTYSQIESGAADVERKGEAGGRKQGTQMQYYDYQGPGSLKMSVEKWPEETEVFVGKVVSPYELEIKEG